MDMDVDVSKDQKKSTNPQQQDANGDDGSMKVISKIPGEFVQVPILSTAEYSIKIGLTLYKVQQNIYLLDFQKLTGDAFSFMTLCANIITELKTLSAASKQAQQALCLAQQQQQQAAAAQQAAQGLPPAGPPGGAAAAPPSK
jgi:5'-AMP-activated protein kinase catalytic alpha subunit